MPLLRKRLPAAGVEVADLIQPETVVFDHDDDADPLRWEVVPFEGLSFDVDLGDLAGGNAKKDFRGRPVLALQLAPVLRRRSLGKKREVFDGELWSMRSLWRYLDELEALAGGPIDTAADFSNEFGLLYRNWLLHEQKLTPGAALAQYRIVRTVLSEARLDAGVADPDLAWPTIWFDRGAQSKDIDPKIFRPLYAVLKDYLRASHAAMAEGQALLAYGINPKEAGDGYDVGLWSRRENFAVAAHAFITEVLEEKSLRVDDYSKVLANPWYFGVPLQGPSIPEREAHRLLDRFRRKETLKARKRRKGWQQVDPEIADAAEAELAELTDDMDGSIDALRWYVPMADDVAAAFFIVCLHCGWNIDAVGNIDAEAMENWCDWRLGNVDGEKDATVAIYAYKNRTGREQIAFSRTRPAFHPFQVIKTSIERSSILRDALRARRTLLGEDASAQSDKKVRREIEAIDQLIRSPWLFYMRSSRGPGGRIGTITNGSNLGRTLARFRREALDRTQSRAVSADDAAYQQLHSITASDFRDGFAAFVYEDGFYNTLLVKRALGHRSLATTEAYLRQRRQIAARFRAFADFQDKIFDEIKKFKVLDPTILYMRVRFDQVTDAQRARLKERRRTRMGMGCLDPDNPPAEVAPNHRGGVCTVQRCTLCAHGVVFEDSLPALARRLAELRHLRSQISADRFNGSTFRLEWLAIEGLLDVVDREAFEAAADAHGREIRDGKSYVFDQSPLTRTA